MFNQMTETQVKGMKNAVTRIRKGETVVRSAINEFAPVAVEHVLAGGNISVVNTLMNACLSTRRDSLRLFFRKMLPYKVDKETGNFTKKFDRTEEISKHEGDFLQFQQSGLTVYGWLEQNAKVEAKEPDYDQRIIRAIEQGFKKGKLTVPHLLALVTKATTDSGHSLSEAAEDAASTETDQLDAANAATA